MKNVYRPLYREMLQTISQAPGRWRPIPLCCFVPLTGQRYARELLIIGRAVNGWGGGWTADEIREGNALDAVLSELFMDDLSMTWVSEQWGSTEVYNTKKSAFWRVIREVVRGLSLADVEDASWPTHIPWSNLYKVSPDAGRNPSEALADVQFPHCTRILEAEINTLTPNRILFLTGINWARPFLANLGFVPDGDIERPVEAAGRIQSGSRVAVLPHPERKAEHPIITGAVQSLGKPGAISAN